ncbi:MAG: M50 family metallopeptidase [Dehalococcoidia bacterium]
MDVLTHSVLPFVGILLALVVIHELGHYVTAKLFGVKVLEAGVGYPPRIWGFKWRDTEYTVNALPLGGFVRLLGEEDPTDPRSLAARPKWQRTVVLASGAFMNLVLAIALFSAGLMIPRQVSSGGARIASVAPNSPAAHAGLKEGDQIERINGRKVSSFEDASYLIRLYQGSHINFTVVRPDPAAGTATTTTIKDVYARWNPQPYTDACGVKQPEGPTGITVTPGGVVHVSRTPAETAQLQQQSETGYLAYRKDVKPGAPPGCGASNFGFQPLTAPVCNTLGQQQRAQAEALKARLFPDAPQPCYEFRPQLATEVITRTRSEPFWTAIPHGARLSVESLIIARNQIWGWIRGFTSPQVTGPVGIAQATGEVVHQAGWLSLIDFAALLSMNLAVLNILPIPMFDGGRLFFILIEAIRRRRIAPEKEAIVHLIGLAMILVFAAVVTYFDILRVFQGGSLLR